MSIDALRAIQSLLPDVEIVQSDAPAVMAGRVGAEQFPQGGEGPLEFAVYRSLRARDSSVTLQAVGDAIGLHDEGDVLRGAPNDDPYGGS